MQDFKDLKVWQRSHLLVLAVYRATGGFPREELFGLTSQMRRAAVSIPANIAEGCGRSGGLDFARHLQIAAGSASEVEYFALLAGELHLLSADEGQRLTSELIDIRRMLTVLIQKVRASR